VSQATLTVQPMPALGPDGRLVSVACRHGVTPVFGANAPDGVPLTEADRVRMALARHYGAARCRCTRQLWEQYFGGPLGTLALGGTHRHSSIQLRHPHLGG
jgi:hypothetical protein